MQKSLIVEISLGGVCFLTTGEKKKKQACCVLILLGSVILLLHAQERTSKT